MAVEAATAADASGSAVLGGGTITWPSAQVRGNAEVGRTQEALSLPAHPSRSQPGPETIVAVVNHVVRAGS